jgi:cysteinyl-tRNA synthetase
MDTNQIKKEDVPPLLAALEQFDAIFSVLKDDDGPKMKQVVEWAESEGREADISRELNGAVGAHQLSDADIEKKIADMEAGRKSRDFKTSDTLRAELMTAGILVENTKEGVRWRRK